MAARLASRGNNDVINYVNIGLIFASFAIALYVPFELFLFAYAILGPAHYLTEISWLQRRRFFAKAGYDGWVLAGLAIAVSLLATFRFGPLRQIGSSQNLAAMIGLGFGSGLVFFLTDKTAARVVGLSLVAVVSFIAVNTSVFLALMLTLFVPTLIHVYVFTGFFMMFGALKDRSRSGYAAFACFVLLPLLYFVIRPGHFIPSNYVVQAYWRPFSDINAFFLGLGVPHSQSQMDDNVRRVFTSGAGLVVMRFIAFAYTYHYLNWFSKTGIIKWHRISGQRMSTIGALWSACVALYIYNDAVAMKVLFCLSFLHVFLEFPLNHMSIVGVLRGLPAAVAGARVSRPQPERGWQLAKRGREA